MKQHLVSILIWVVVVGAAFGLAWYKGYVVRARAYWEATMEELRKCAWPTWNELKGSTVVVSITIVLLGVSCYAVDTAFYYMVRAITL